MKRLLFYSVILSVLIACSTGKSIRNETLQQVETALDLARQKSLAMAESLADRPDRLPKTIGADGTLETCASDWWVSGFFPGQLWYLYEYSGDSMLRHWAENFTWRVANQQYTTDNHDVGFMIFCSFGNAWRITGDSVYLLAIENASKSLITRFNPLVGCIKSWDTHTWNSPWQYAVIIDNMMNLELLEWSARKFNEPFFSVVARTHANTTILNHFRSDGSSFHVVSYDTITGEPHAKHTAQGFSHESAWARGQAWGLYGYTMMFRETGDSAYLQQAIQIADFLVNHPHLPEDKIPYWDFDAPNIPEALRDASAGAIMCSALLELYEFADESRTDLYFQTAEMQLKALCSAPYLSAMGENANFILKHGVGHLPNNSEVDVPLTYADYYFVEAMLRYLEIHKK